MQPVLLGSLILAAGCGSGTKTSTGRTERETDSVIANSAVPGASAVGKAMNVADSTSNQAHQADSVGGAP
jgi:hypothetical protein